MPINPIGCGDLRSHPRKWDQDTWEMLGIPQRLAYIGTNEIWTSAYETYQHININTFSLFEFPAPHRILGLMFYHQTFSPGYSLVNDSPSCLSLGSNIWCVVQIRPADVVSCGFVAALPSREWHASLLFDIKASRKIYLHLVASSLDCISPATEMSNNMLPVTPESDPNLRVTIMNYWILVIKCILIKNLMSKKK